MKPIDNLGLVCRTRERRDHTATDRYHRLIRVVRREAAARAGYPAGRPVIQKFDGLCGRVSTDGSELFEMLGTADDGYGERIQEQKRGLVPTGRSVGGSTLRTLNFRRLLGDVRLWLVGLSGAHDK